MHFDRWSLIASDNYRIFDRKSTIAGTFHTTINFRRTSHFFLCYTGRSQLQSFRSAYRRMVTLTGSPQKSLKHQFLFVFTLLSPSDRPWGATWQQPQLLVIVLLLGLVWTHDLAGLNAWSTWFKHMIYRFCEKASFCRNKPFWKIRRQWWLKHRIYLQILWFKHMTYLCKKTAEN